MVDRRSCDDEVAAFLSGDPVSIAGIRGAVGRVVRSFRFGGAGLHDDLVQETLYRICLNLSEGAFRGEASLRTYAQSVARYVCLEQIRRRRAAEVIDPAPASARQVEALPESELLRAEEHRRNLRRLSSLSTECLELFRLTLIEELSYAEVARRLGISENAVKLRVRRCRLSAAVLDEPKRSPHRRPSPETRPLFRHYKKVEE